MDESELAGEFARNYEVLCSFFRKQDFYENGSEEKKKSIDDFLKNPLAIAHFAGNYLRSIGYLPSQKPVSFHESFVTSLFLSPMYLSASKSEKEAIANYALSPSVKQAANIVEKQDLMKNISKHVDSATKILEKTVNNYR